MLTTSQFLETVQKTVTFSDTEILCKVSLSQLSYLSLKNLFHKLHFNYILKNMTLLQLTFQLSTMVLIWQKFTNRPSPSVIKHTHWFRYIYCYCIKVKLTERQSTQNILSGNGKTRQKKKKKKIPSSICKVCLNFLTIITQLQTGSLEVTQTYIGQPWVCYVLPRRSLSFHHWYYGPNLDVKYKFKKIKYSLSNYFIAICS